MIKKILYFSTILLTVGLGASLSSEHYDKFSEEDYYKKNCYHYYDTFTPQLFHKDSPLTVHAAYYDKRDNRISWVLFTTFEEGFLTIIPEENYEFPEYYIGPKCIISSWKLYKDDLFKTQGIQTGHAGGSVRDIDGFILSKFEENALKVFVSPQSAIFILKVNRINDKDINSGLNDFFEKIKKDLTIVIPPNVTLVNWFDNTDDVTQYLTKEDKLDCFCSEESPYAPLYIKETKNQ